MRGEEDRRAPVEHEDISGVSLSRGQEKAIGQIKALISPRPSRQWFRRREQQKPPNVITLTGFPGAGKTTVLEHIDLPPNWEVDPQLPAVDDHASMALFERSIREEGKRYLLTGDPGLRYDTRVLRIMHLGEEGVYLSSMDTKETISLLRNLTRQRETSQSGLHLSEAEIVRTSLGIPVLLKNLLAANPPDIESAIQLVVDYTTDWAGYVLAPHYLSMPLDVDLQAALQKADKERGEKNIRDSIIERFIKAQTTLADKGNEIPLPSSQMLTDYVTDWGVSNASHAPLQIVATGMTEEQFGQLRSHFGFGEKIGSFREGSVPQAFGITSDREYISKINNGRAGEILAVGHRGHYDLSDVQAIIDELTAIGRFPIGPINTTVLFDYSNHGRVQNRMLSGFATEAVLQGMKVPYFRHMENSGVGSDRIYDPSIDSYAT